MARTSKQRTIPPLIINALLDNINYVANKGNTTIRRKHILDINCYHPNLLITIVGRYIQQCKIDGLSVEDTQKELETYIHGTHHDKGYIVNVVMALDKIVSQYGFYDVKWDVRDANLFIDNIHENNMNYVVGLPLIQRITDLPKSKRKYYRYRGFAPKIVANTCYTSYALGLEILKDKGILSFLTPSNWHYDKSAQHLRKYLRVNPILYSLISIDGFNITPHFNYENITLIKGLEIDKIKYYCFDNTNNLYLDGVYPFRKCCNRFECVGTPYNLLERRKKYTRRKLRILKHEKFEKGKQEFFTVKHGIITNKDNVFTHTEFPFRSSDIIPAIHASQDKLNELIFPYDYDGLPKSFSELDFDTQAWLIKGFDKEYRKKYPTSWWKYPKRQGTSNVYRDHFSINRFVSNKDNVHIKFIPKGTALLSGYAIYAPEECTLEILTDMLKSDDFFEHLKKVRPINNNMYFLSMADIEVYLNRKWKQMLKI